MSDVIEPVKSLSFNLRSAKDVDSENDGSNPRKEFPSRWSVPSRGLLAVKNAGKLPVSLLKFNKTVSNPVNLDQSGNEPETDSRVSAKKVRWEMKETSKGKVPVMFLGFP